ncbi:MAG TPA: inorganic phosphate transporter [Actinomycetes bacterium]
MGSALVVVVVLGLAFDFSNGFHDSSNAIAAPVATGAMTPGQAVTVSATFNLLGPVIAGTAVAGTVGGIVTLDPGQTMTVLTCALAAALTWNLLTWWRGLPSSSSHALVGGLVGAGVVTAGTQSINWGGFDGLRPVGVIGILVGLAISPLLGGFVGALAELAARRGLRRARRRMERPILRGEWVTAAGLAFAHGTNDAQKTMGVIAAALVASGVVSSFTVPLWVKVACATALTVGSALGGWRIVRTIGRGIFRMGPLDGLVSQGSSAGVIGVAAFLGAPVSTTHVVASSVVGLGAARRRRHVRWPVVREILLAWLVTVPSCVGMAGILAGAWRIAS